MGHREDLLEGAKKCLLEKGFARTTARDIVAASKTNLGSIGYHFGTKDALMNQALIEATTDWSMELGKALSAEYEPGLSPLERFETTWTRVIELFETHSALWLAQFEIFTHIQHAPEMRPFFAEAQKTAQLELGKLLQLVDDNTDTKSIRAVGSFCLAMMTGLIAQWLVDAESAPSGADLAKAVRLIAEVGSVVGAP